MIYLAELFPYKFTPKQREGLIEYFKSCPDTLWLLRYLWPEYKEVGKLHALVKKRFGENPFTIDYDGQQRSDK